MAVVKKCEASARKLGRGSAAPAQCEAAARNVSEATGELLCWRDVYRRRNQRANKASWWRNVGRASARRFALSIPIKVMVFNVKCLLACYCVSETKTITLYSAAGMICMAARLRQPAGPRPIARKLGLIAATSS